MPSALPHAAGACNKRLRMTGTRVQAGPAAAEALPAVKVPKPVTSVLRAPMIPLPSIGMGLKPCCLYYSVLRSAMTDLSAYAEARC